jgi:hypothetical protein
MTEPPTTDASATEDPPVETTGEPLPALTQVFPLHMEQGPHSGLEGIALWQSGMPDGCEAPPPASCTDLPELGEPLLLVDGLVQDADAVQLSSRVAVLFPFAHPACEMGCGKISFTVQLGEDGVGGDGLGGLPVDLPCSTEASDVWIGIDFNVVTLKDQYTAKLALTDRCGATTEAQELVFTPK